MNRYKVATPDGNTEFIEATGFGVNGGGTLTFLDGSGTRIRQFPNKTWQLVQDCPDGEWPAEGAN